MPTKQLTIFDQLIIYSATKMLDMLNENLKEKDKYFGNYYTEWYGNTLFIVCNKNKDVLCNILDENGKIPNGFCANWRNLELIERN